MDKNEKERITLGVLKGEPVIDLADENEKRRAEFTLKKNGPTFDLLDENGGVFRGTYRKTDRRTPKGRELQA